MAAYSCIASLMQILNQALQSDRPDWIYHCERKQIQSLYKKLESFQQIYDSYSASMAQNVQAEVENLEEQITDVLIQIEDLIETHIADLRTKHGHLGNKNNILGRLEKVRYSFFSLLACTSPSFMPQETQKFPTNSTCHCLIDDGWIDKMNRNKFGRRLSDLINEIDPLMARVSDCLRDIDIPSKRQSKQASPAHLSRPISDFHDDVVVGFDQDIESLRSRLLSKSTDMQVVTIEGIGGIGKTTLAQKLYSDQEVAKHFDVQAWTTVSQEYNVREMLCNLLSCLTTDKMESMDCSQLKHKLQMSLKGPRYLIVLDDIWGIDAWEQLMTCFPSDYNNGSRILMTTRNLTVANNICGNVPIHRLPLLETEESWNLLCEKVFLGKGCPPELHEIGVEIAKRCGGLRLAIIVIAGLLSKIDQTKEEWYRVAENLNSIITNNVGDCMSILALSYKHLPYHLKPCFMYMSIFPEDFEIPKWKLLRLWIAEGFLKIEKDQLPEEAAARCLEELAGRNLILAGRKSCDGKIKTYKMHDILRELSIKEAEKDKFLQAFHQSDHYTNFQRTRRAHRLVVQHELPRKVDLGLTRSITSYSLRITNFSFRYPLLRVLNWELPVDEYSSTTESVWKLVNLRYLHLMYIHELPESVANMLDLQTLIVGSVHYPKESFEFQKWWKMSKLRHLQCDNINQSFSFCSLPVEIEGDKSWFLGNLQTLHGIGPPSCTDQVFQRTPNLKRLVVHECSCSKRAACQHAQPCINSIHLLSNLEYLKFKCYELRGYSPWPRLPQSKESLSQKLKKLTLQGMRFPWEDMRVLGMLPNLEVLKLKMRAFDGRVWEPTTGGFVRLKFLLLDFTCPTECWKDVEAPFPKLERLVLKNWNIYPSVIPTGIGEILTLQSIELYYCLESVVASAALIQQDKQDLGDDDFRVITKGTFPATAGTLVH